MTKANKMHAWNEKKEQHPVKPKSGEPIPGTGVTTKKIKQKH